MASVAAVAATASSPPPASPPAAANANANTATSTVNNTPGTPTPATPTAPATIATAISSDSSPPLGEPLSTPSNPSRGPPTPDEPPPPTSPPTAQSTISTARHRIPSFPPPQPSRISIMSTLSAKGEPFHAQFVSSLSYTSVRDFAYPALHPLHYGPSSATSGLSTPAGSQRGSQYFDHGSNHGGQAGTWFTGGGGGYRRLSDPAHPSYDFGLGGDATWGGDSYRQRSNHNDNHPHHHQPPPLNFSDGPPWSEDEDLQSPVVVSKHRKHKSSAAHLQTSSQHSRGQSKNVITPTTLQHFAGNSHGASDGGCGPRRGIGNGDVGCGGEEDWDGERRSILENGISPGGDYYTGRLGRRTDLAGGEPGGELYNHPGDGEGYGPNSARQYYHSHHQGGGYGGGGRGPLDVRDGDEIDDLLDDDDDLEEEDSRFSRDYQFTIASPDEEMHGKAVALFDFIRENENELPLVEGQVVWVSYRIGVGWLVAEDPKTGESGLVPEEYVRLLRDLQPLYTPQPESGSPPNHHHGQESPLILSGSPQPPSPSPSSPQQPPSTSSTSATSTSNNSALNPPIISTFSTSSQDVHPYPFQFHYPNDHPPAHIRAKSSPDLTGVETPTAGDHKDRIAQLQREQERAVLEEAAMGGTPRVRTGVGLGLGKGGGGEEVFYDAMERQHGQQQSSVGELDFREEGRGR
ncbi:unnamed protein product [Tuber aestivum]|uniref:SH3 domain-containing protein n=1 Tax=Tuber aestivum TaxID=59557 RepID=A0A292Q436_9PEZI|nr:unnamed protein product [Tuber aestivum]